MWQGQCSSSAELELKPRIKVIRRLGDDTESDAIANGEDDRRDVVPDSAFTVFRARVNAHLARAPTAAITFQYYIYYYYFFSHSPSFLSL